MADVRVRCVRDEAADIRSFELEPLPGEALPAFAAGAHIEVRLRERLLRQYSLCNAPHETDAYRIAVKLEPDSRGGSLAMHELREGDVLSISAPRNNFPLRLDAGHSVLMAGGIGITPLLSMAYQLQALRRPFELHYFARSTLHTAFRSRLAASDFQGKVSFYPGLEADAVGAILQERLGRRPDGGHLYLCGPRPFMDRVGQAAQAWSMEAVHLEYFTADRAAFDGASGPFTVQLASSGVEYIVPADRSIAEVLAENGVAIEVSCEQGVCGTCLTGLIAGEPEHRDMYLTPDERAAGNQLLPCVSRAKGGRLVLDL